MRLLVATPWKRPVLRLFFLLVLSPVWHAFAQAQRVGPIRVNAQNARAYRDSLIRRVFGTTTFPYQWLPDSVITQVNSIDYLTGFPFTALMNTRGNLSSIDKLVVTVDADRVNFPEPSKIYLFRPIRSNGKLFIYHAGHCAGNAMAEDIMVNGSGRGSGLVIPRMVREGYTVLAVPMIHYRNRPPTGYVCGYNGHDPLFLDSLYAYPLGLFFKPLIASLNSLGRSNYTDIYMCGLSGGGWVCSVYPAMDSSITLSVPVAGSWPIAVRNMFYTGGDSEQYYPPVFKQLLDYHELYALSCLAPARRMLQINNRYDACCFNGAYPHIYYVDSVARVLEGTGGTFRFYLDETGYQHAITRKALQVMLTFIGGSEASLAVAPPDSLYGGFSYRYSIKDQYMLNRPAADMPLRYSILKEPEWMYLNSTTGELLGQATPAGFIPSRDTVSFKVEDDEGHFVVYSTQLVKKRDRPYFFTLNRDSQTVYLLPHYARSLLQADSLSADYFFFNTPSVQVLRLSVMQQSLIRLELNRPLEPGDSIGYAGMRETYPIRYANGSLMDDFGIQPVRRDALNNQIALPGMIRFNSDTRKFEYFNGTAWVSMH